jgi:hypothetical protein
MQLLDEGIITMDHLIKRKNKTGAAAEKVLYLRLILKI